MTLSDLATSRTGDLLGKILSQIVLTKPGTNSRWLNVTKITYGRDFYPQIVLKLNSFPDPYFSHVIFDMGAYNFITCHGYGEGLDWGVYINPFDPWTWAAVVVSMITGPMIGYVLLRLLGRDTVVAKTFFMNLMEANVFALASQFYSRTQTYSKMTLRAGKQFKFLFRISWATFLLSCIVLINYYIGLGISNVTAPKGQVLRWRSIEDVRNSTILVSFSGEQSIKDVVNWTDTKQRKEYYYSELGIDLYHAIYDCAKLVENGMSAKFCAKMGIILDQLKTSIQPLHGIGEELSQDGCSHQIFYLVTESAVEETLLGLKAQFPTVPFYKGTSTFHTHRKGGWKIGLSGMGGIYKRINKLVEGGIVSFLKIITSLRQKKEVEVLKVNGSKGFKSQSLDSNGIVIFFFVFGLWGVAGVAFVMELVRKGPCFSEKVVKF